MELTFDLQTPDGKPAEALAKIIEARKRELGETTKQSCVALAQNILRAVRAQTKVANPSQMDISLTLADDKYFPSFKRDTGVKGKNASKRVLRQGQNGPVVTPKKVFWKLGKYTKKQVAHSYEVQDKISDDKVIQYIIVTETEKKALRFAKQFHRSRVKRYKGLAKVAIGMAMKAVYDKSATNDNATQQVRSLANQNVDTSIQETGFNSGTVNIHIHDKLNYAALALQNGHTSLNTAVGNALNKVLGYLQQRIKQNGGDIDKSLKMTADELAGKGAV